MIKNTENLREKKAKHNYFSFKRKGNSLQFKFNSGLQDKIEDIFEDQNLYELTVEALNIIVFKISKKSKVIKIEDQGG